MLRFLFCLVLSKYVVVLIVGRICGGGKDYLKVRNLVGKKETEDFMEANYLVNVKQQKLS